MSPIAINIDSVDLLDMWEAAGDELGAGVGWGTRAIRDVLGGDAEFIAPIQDFIVERQQFLIEAVETLGKIPVAFAKQVGGGSVAIVMALGDVGTGMTRQLGMLIIELAPTANRMLRSATMITGKVVEGAVEVASELESPMTAWAIAAGLAAAAVVVVMVLK